MSWTIFSLIIFAISVIQAAVIQAQDDERNVYSKRYDNIDVETIFRSSRLLNNYVDCLLDRKPCPPEGKELKRVLPQALKSKCSRCTKIQKAKALDVISRLYYQHPSIYLSLAERYDPTGEYTRNFEEWHEQTHLDKPGVQFQSDELPQKSRIPSTWITKTTTTPRPTTQTTTTTRQTLRTLPTTSRLRVLTTERPIVIPSTQRPTLPPQTKSTTTTTARSIDSSTLGVIPIERKVAQLPIPPLNQQLEPPAIQPFEPAVNLRFSAPDNQQFTPQNQQVPQVVNLPQTINQQIPQFINQQALPQQPIIQTIPSTTSTELPRVIITDPTTSSFRPLPQSTGNNVPNTGINAFSSVATEGTFQTFPTAQVPLSNPPASPSIQLQITSISSNNVQQVPSFGNFQPPFLTPTFGSPQGQNINNNVPAQPVSQIDPNFIDNFFVPRGGLIRRSVDQILDTTRGFMRAIFRIY
ncbi:poly(A) polymerase-like [Chironomus tepperi]|uniref:poly(A) polymerase-like n=1 Tax=Chironomus tepperi TaxID=113505 RepID=UPI00391EF0BE